MRDSTDASSSGYVTRLDDPSTTNERDQLDHCFPSARGPLSNKLDHEDRPPLLTHHCCSVRAEFHSLCSKMRTSSVVSMIVVVALVCLAATTLVEAKKHKLRTDNTRTSMQQRQLRCILGVASTSCPQQTNLPAELISVDAGHVFPFLCVASAANHPQYTADLDTLAHWARIKASYEARNYTRTPRKATGGRRPFPFANVSSPYDGVYGVDVSSAQGIGTW